MTNLQSVNDSFTVTTWGVFPITGFANNGWMARNLFAQLFRMMFCHFSMQNLELQHTRSQADSFMLMTTAVRDRIPPPRRTWSWSNPSTIWRGLPCLRYNFHENPVTLSGNVSQIVEKIPCLAMLKNPFKKVLDPDPEEVQNLLRTSLSEATAMIKFSWRSDHLFEKYERNVSRNALSYNVKESVKRVLDPDPRADEFQNLIISSPDWCLPVCEVCWIVTCIERE